jgi:uncharacterized damage-inducible protein DinB
MQTSPHNTTATALWHYNAALLAQAAAMVMRLGKEAVADFDYGRAVGPHLRHIVEHYQALVNALKAGDQCVCYDARNRDLRIQTDPVATLSALKQLNESFALLAQDQSLGLQTPLLTKLLAGARGEMELTVQTTLGRELLFLSSHTVHHFAPLGQYCRNAGVELGHDFGKAPATVAFEQLYATATASA